jgi:hypothetical protein
MNPYDARSVLPDRRAVHYNAVTYFVKRALSLISETIRHALWIGLSSQTLRLGCIFKSRPSAFVISLSNMYSTMNDGHQYCCVLICSNRNPLCLVIFVSSDQCISRGAFVSILPAHPVNNQPSPYSRQSRHRSLVKYSS